MNTHEPFVTRYRRAPDTSLRYYIQPVLERKWIVLLTCFATLSVTFGAVKLVQPLYQAQVTLMQTESSSQSSLPFLDPYLQESSGSASIQGHMEILRSTASIGKIQEKLKQESQLEFTPGQIVAGFSLSTQKGSPIIRLTATADTSERAQALANAMAAVYIQQLNEIQKSDLTQGMIFLKQQMASVNEKLTAVERTVNTLKTDEKVASRSQKPSLGTLASQGLLNQLQELELELAETQMDIEWTEAQLKSIQISIAEGERVLSSTPQVEQMQSKLFELQLQLASVRGKFTEKAPEVVSLTRQIETLQGQLDAELAKRQNNGLNNQSHYSLSELQKLKQQMLSLDLKLQSLRPKEVLLKQQRANFKKEHPSLVTEQIELTSLERQARVHEQTYLMLLEKYEEMSLAREMEMSRLQIIQEAQLPVSPTGLSGKLLMPLSGMLGLGFGVGLAFLLQYLDDSIRRKEDVEKYLALPVMGSIPKMRSFKVPKRLLTETERKPRKQTQKLLNHILPFDESGSPAWKGESGKSAAVMAAYQKLAAQIEYLHERTAIKTILVTSTVPDEGKTTVSTNLALCLARSGKKVLLVDADLQGREIHRIFQQDGSPGLIDFFLEANDTQEGVPLVAPFIRNAGDNLSIFPAGTLVSSPERSSSSEKWAQLVKRLRDDYDVILFDSPPVLSAEAVRLAIHMDGTLLIARSGRSKRQMTREAIELLENVQAKILGVVLNGSPASRYYGSSYYEK